MIDKYYILLACYPDKGMKSCGSKGLLKFNNKKLLEHQIDWIKDTLETDNIIIIADFDFNKINKSLDDKFILLNSNGNNPIVQCCKNIPEAHLCFIDYGCIFNPKILLDFSFKESEIICIKNTNTSNNLDIGCTITNDYIEYMFFDLPKNKFCNIFTIVNSDKEKINKISSFNKNLLSFEILNTLIQYNSTIRPIFIHNNFIYFNHMRQKNAINKFIKQNSY